MRNRASAFLAAAMLICLIPTAGHALEPYSQDFEALNQVDPAALSADGWLVFGNVSNAEGTYLYGYGPFPAPNHNVAFSQIDFGQGGDDQGFQQLVVFSDYNNVDHANGHLIESNVYQEQDITAEDVGFRWTFEFQAKRGNLAGSSTALAFIKTLDPANGHALTNFISVDMTTIPETWDGFTLSIDIDASLEGQILQIGFANTATLYESSAIFYDNIIFYEAGPVGVPDSAAALGAALGQNYPNPFNPRTRIDFSLEQPTNVTIAVFDVVGRRVATLHQGALAEGDHHVIWNGQTDMGTPAPAGQYRYALQTATGQVTRSMVLVK